MSETRLLIEDSVGKILRSLAIAPSAKGIEQADWSDKLWTSLTEAGLTRIALSERSGGTASWPDALALLRIAGRSYVPVPLAESILGLYLLEQAGLPFHDGPLAIGPVVSTAVLDVCKSEAGDQIVGAIDVTGLRSSAQPVVSIARAEAGRYAVVLLDPSKAQASRTFDDGLADRKMLRFSGAGLLARGAAGVAGLTPESLRSIGAALRVAQMTGALETVLDLSVQYVKDRKQFGSPLAKFQAVQQLLAVLAGEVAASVMAFEALLESFGRELFELEVAIAKSRVSEAAGIATAHAHQVHGAMGFTAEYALQLSSKKLWMWRDDFGSELEWHAWLGRFAARAGSASVWDMISTRTV